MSLRTRALLPVCTAAVLLLAATASHAAIPQLNAQCPGGIDVHADAGGPVFVQGREAQLKPQLHRSAGRTGGLQRTQRWQRPAGDPATGGRALHRGDR